MRPLVSGLHKLTLCGSTRVEVDIIDSELRDVSLNAPADDYPKLRSMSFHGIDVDLHPRTRRAFRDNNFQGGAKFCIDSN